MTEDTRKSVKISGQAYEELSRESIKIGKPISEVLEAKLKGGADYFGVKEYINETTDKLAVKFLKTFEQVLEEKNKKFNENLNKKSGVTATQKTETKPKPEKVKELSKMLKTILETVDPTCRKLDQVLIQVKKLVDIADEHNKQVSEDKKTMVLALGYARATISFLKKNGETVYITESADEIEQSEGEK